jgi:hypothetical protein
MNIRYRGKQVMFIILLMACLATIGLISACVSSKGPAVIQESATKIVPSSDFQVSELLIDPAVVAPGEPVFITTKVTNTSEFDGTYEAKLSVNKVVEVSNTVIIPAGETRALVFSLSRDIRGTYQVALDRNVGQFAVAESVTTQSNNAVSVGSQPTNSGCCGSSGSCRCGATSSSSPSPQRGRTGGCGYGN